MFWSRNADGQRFRSSSPVVPGGWIYLLSSSSFFIFNVLSRDIIVKKDLPFALDRKTLSEKWNYP